MRYSNLNNVAWLIFTGYVHEYSLNAIPVRKTIKSDIDYKDKEYE